jgi:hypothetical protein
VYVVTVDHALDSLGHRRTALKLYWAGWWSMTVSSQGPSAKVLSASSSALSAARP